MAVVGIAVLLFWPGPTTYHANVFYNASFERPFPSKKLSPLCRRACFERLYSLHSVTAGTAVVLRYRKDIDVARFGVDDEQFEEVSLSLPSNILGKAIELPHAGVDVYVTKGAAAWFSFCNGKYGDKIRGKLYTYVDGLNVHVEAQFSADLVNARNLEEVTEDFRIVNNFEPSSLANARRKVPKNAFEPHCGDSN